MASAKVANPTSNLFSLLADDAPEPSSVTSAPKAKKEPAAQKKAAAPAEKEAAGGALTPAEKAKAREAKQAKSPKPVHHQDRAPRRSGDSPQADDRNSGPRGTGNRGARRAVNAEQHGHQAPNRGRAFDRQSGAQTTRKPPPKKGGAGKGNWGDDVKDSVVDQDTASAVSGWGDGTAKPAVEDNKEKAEEEATEAAPEEPAAPAEPEEIQLSMDDYLKQKEEASKALLAKVGVIQPRKLENVDLSGAVESKRSEATPGQPTAAASEAVSTRKGTKALDVSEVFRVHVAPVGGDDRPRGRGRGRGRGGDRGRGERAPRGDRPPRADGDRPPRNDGDRPPRAEGEKPRGGGRGGRGGRGGGDRGGRGRPLDTTNNRQFPSLGQ
jgi:plasminogen activator inhibitor 1 RNA-binding protein